MKKTFCSVALLALSVSVLPSCGNDDDPIGELTDDVVIKNDADAANFVKSIFKTQNCGSGYSFLLETVSEATVSFEGPDTESGPLVSLFDIQPNNDYLYIWGKQYTAIAEANNAIEKISAIEAGEGKTLSEIGKNTALGGAYFVRGLAYFYLVQLWGEVPLYLSTQNATNGSPESVAKIYAQIESDLKKATELLPEFTSYKTEPSQHAAEAILSKVYLTWAQYSPEGDLPTPPADQAKLANAVTYADKVINSERYILEDDITKNWGRFNKNRQEHIYNISYVLGEDGPNDGGNHQSHCAFSYGFDVDPTTQPPHIGPSSFDLYEKWDGLTEATTQYDQRREFSYTAHLAKPKSGATPAEDVVYNFVPPTHLPYFGKGIDRSFYEGPLVGPTERDMDRIEIRYAEVLLIKAEALIEQNKELETAKGLINQIRQRAYHFAPDGFAVPLITATSQAELRASLQQERFNEFVYEQKRFLDLARWHNLVRTVQKVADFTEYKTNYEAGSFLLKVHNHLHARYDAVTGSGTKYYHFPIPESALETNPNLHN